MKNRLLTGVGILAWMCTARVSLGQTAVDAAELFERAKKLMDAGDLAVACPMIQQSYDAEPKVGRLYTLATCRDREGRMATALDLYRTYLQSVSEMNEQTRQNHADREKTATERMQVLEAQVPKLKLVWHGKLPKDAKVKVDESDALARLNTEWPMDPGEHWVVVERAGHVEAPRVVTLEGGKPMVEVDLTPPVAITGSTPMTPQQDKAAEKPVLGPKPLGTILPIPPAHITPQRAFGFVAVGVGGAAVIAGGVLGALALVDKRTVDRECFTNGCTQRGLDAENEGRVVGNAAMVPLLVGAALTVTGIVLVLPVKKANAQLRTSVYVNAGGIVTLQGAF